ncbi:MAG: hypothetical protein K1X64_08525 [Myxococcaceae bacterium]|nr:hypothetical protein [Myxococcaceae bacterium]
MLLSLLTLSLLGASTEPIKIAAPSLQLVNIDPKLGDFYTEHLAQQLTFQGLHTQTPKDIAAVLGLERQRKLLGCSEGDCTTELGRALGVDGILLGSVTRVERTYQVNVRIISAVDAALLGSVSTSSEDNDRLVGSFSVVAQQLAKQVAAKLNRPLTLDSSVSVTTTAGTVKRVSWAPLAVGVAGAVVGGIFFAQGAHTHQKLVTRSGTALSADEANALVRQGQQQQLIGWVGTGVAIAGVAAAAGMFFLGGDEEIRASVAVSPGALSLGIGGVWP